MALASGLDKNNPTLQKTTARLLEYIYGRSTWPDPAEKHDNPLAWDVWVRHFSAAVLAQIDPLHPNDVRYVFLGDEVDLRGHPHPPLDAWVLAALLRVFGDVREVPFHLVFAGFSLVAAWAMRSLARRFSPHPLWATLTFLAVPVFVVNGNSLEADLPFLAFWLASVALFVGGRTVLAAFAMALCASPRRCFAAFRSLPIPRQIPAMPP